MATQESSVPTVTMRPIDRPRPYRATVPRREAAWGLLFISPWIFGFVVFTALPMAAALLLSVTDFDPRNPSGIHYVGLANYQRMLVDPLVRNALVVTLKFAAVMLPLTMGVALGIAILVNDRRLYGRTIFRTLFYMPTQIPVVATTIVFLGVLNPRIGWFSYVLGWFGISSPSWFNDPTWIYVALSFIALWGIGNMMLIFLAGLQSVPTDLYEASRVDGAGRWAQFRHVTLPMISPVLFYNLIISLVGTFQYFTQPYVITNGLGDPDNATLFFNLDLYREGWRYYHMGYACALAWLLFAIVLILTLFLFRTARYWVYEGSAR